MRVVVDRVAKTYAGVRALDDVSLAFEPGQIVALLGANGAGKTTLLRCLAGIAGLDTGTISYDGHTFHRGRLDLRRRFMFLPDVPAVLPAMTPVQHLGMVLRIYEAPPRGIEERSLEVLSDLDMLGYLEAPCGSLSRGQAYRAALAPLLVVDPELWLLDEPLASGMDPRGIATWKRRARDAASRGRTVIFSTQIVEVAESLADRVCLLASGAVRAFGTVSEIGADQGIEALLLGLSERAS